MFRSRLSYARWITGTMLCIALGCSNQTAPPSSKEKPKAGNAAPAAKAATADKAAQAPKAEAKTETPKAAPAPTPEKVADAPMKTPEKSTDEKKVEEKKEETKEAATAAPSGKVLLGTPELTKGIPGEGPLKIEEIKAWFSKPENHQPLEVELPLGLSAGQSQIKGLDKNPLTRAKIELGRQLYFDPRLSADNTISCASCHAAESGWTRDTQFGVGIGDQKGNRNSPVSYNRILSDAQFWDGRAASLEEQAVGPIANPIEMGNTHEACVESLKKIEGYRLEFESVFGSEGVTIQNVGRALASFERTIVTSPTPYDYYEVLANYKKNFSEDDLAELKTDDPEAFAKYEAAKKASDAHPMSESALRGRDLYFSERVGCATCHVGPNLSDEKYHNIGVGMDKPEPDLGRFVVTKDEKDKGAFKTPTIRNVAQTAPYMHDGSQKTLEEVVDWYDKGGHPNPHLSDKIKKIGLKDQEKKDLVEFMKACTGEFPPMELGRRPE